METNLVLEGFKFMGLGMGTVFVFLIIMILVMQAMAAIIDRFFPEPQVAETTNSVSKDNKKIIAAITAAVKYHREG